MMWLEQRGIQATYGIAEGVVVIEDILARLRLRRGRVDLCRHDLDGVCSSKCFGGGVARRCVEETAICEFNAPETAAHSRSYLMFGAFQ
jgi:hypothetical protein